ncbi:hypothetical protein OAP63_08930 [Vibrio sp.]|uniref:hypothetical protein n=1 Tax=Vibrio viridaestus TaxID=2487322 RepID=UPI000F6136AA|nr:hypothetical protein [Vibrio viridaestus]MDC0610847.1 hypothetical protein [Vibrio sp.]
MQTNNRYRLLTLCLMALVIFMSGGRASALPFLNTESNPVVKISSHSTHHQSMETVVESISSDHCLSMHGDMMKHGHNSSHCSDHSLSGSCGENVCGSVLGALNASSSFLVNFISYPQNYFSSISNELQGHSSSLYRPPIV